MTRHLPPLSALRAFEAVARHLNFTKAADELHVTPAAVSQQVKVLEDHLGTALFRRTKRSVALTDAGRVILPDVQAGFEWFGRALDKVSTHAATKTLTISVAPSFASKWLLPRLGRFSALYPEIDIRISATMTLVDFRKDEADLAIRFGKGPYPGVDVEKLFPEALTPMCSPNLLNGKHPLKTPDDLRHFRLLHDVSIPGGDRQLWWVQWLTAARAIKVNPNRGPRFSLAELALQAAIDDGGVVLGRVALAADDIAAGRLVCPFEFMMPLDVNYFLVLPVHNRHRAEIGAFRSWLRAEVLRSIPMRALTQSEGHAS